MRTFPSQFGLLTPKRASALSAFAMMLLPVVVLADNCAYEETLHFTLPAETIHALDISAGAGALQVASTPTAREISVEARVCASRKSGLEGMGVEHLVQEGVQHLWSKIPENQSSFWRSQVAFIDLMVTVPEGLPVHVADGSGFTSISGTGNLTLVDGSGDVEIFAIAGDVSVDDGSGDVRIEDVTGNVQVEDGSGDIQIVKVGGAVTLRDGSGDIAVRDVQLEVSILEDGSGDVNVDKAMRSTSAGQVSANLE